MTRENCDCFNLIAFAFYVVITVVFYSTCYKSIYLTEKLDNGKFGFGFTSLNKGNTSYKQNLLKTTALAYVHCKKEKNIKKKVLAYGHCKKEKTYKRRG